MEEGGGGGREVGKTDGRSRRSTVTLREGGWGGKKGKAWLEVGDVRESWDWGFGGFEGLGIVGLEGGMAT